MYFILFHSNKPNKKYAAVYIKNNKLKEIHFGDSRYEDYTQHKDPVRKQRYINRHKKHEDWSNPFTAGFWSRWLLWNKPTLDASIEDIEKRFNIDIQ